MTALGDFLRESASRRREAGVWDCCTFPAAWAMQCGAADPMADMRGAYATEADALRLIQNRGGLDGLFSDALEAVGWQRRDGPPRPGDIGVVSLHGFDAGAIWTGERWALVADAGLVFAQLPDSATRGVWGP